MDATRSDQTRIFDRAVAAVRGRWPGAGLLGVRPLQGGTSSLTFAGELAVPGRETRRAVLKLALAGLSAVGNRDALRQARLLRLLADVPGVLADVIARLGKTLTAGRSGRLQQAAKEAMDVDRTGAITVPGMLDLRASEIPDKVAVIWDDRNETYRDLWQAARSAAAGLLGLGLGKGDRFAVYLRNSPEYVHVWLAGLYVGIQPVTINLAYFGDFLHHQLVDSGAKLVVTSADKLEDVLAVVSRCPLVEKVVVLGADQGQPGCVRKLGLPVLPFSDLRRAALSQDFSLVGPDDPGAVIYTSGTTGPSKGVRLSQGTLAYVAGAHCSIMGLAQDDVALIAMPLFHVSGMNGVSNTLFAGCTTVFERRFSAATVLRRMLDHGVTATTVAGPMLKMLWNHPRSGDESELRLRLIYAGSALPASFSELQDRFGIDYVCTAYGQSEVQASIAGRMPGLPAGSVGKPLPAFETRLVDEAGDDVPPGAAGELLVRPRIPHAVFSGYLNDPRPETTFSADGWYRSGDVLSCDLEGFFYLVDRKKDVVRRRGENISSVEVEDAIGRHPAVADVAVHAVPSDFGEDEVKAVVVVAESAEVSPEELHQFCVSCLPQFAIPRYIEFVDALPRNPLGRVQKFALRERGVTATTWDRESAAAFPGGHLPRSTGQLPDLTTSPSLN